MKEKGVRLKSLLKGLTRLQRIIAATCLISGTVTYLILLASAYAGRVMSKSSSANAVPDYMRYQAMGYTGDTVTTKRRLLLSINEDGALCRSMLCSFDLDLNTLDVLELPPMTLMEGEGYTARLEECYGSDAYSKVLENAAGLRLDGVMDMDTRAFSRIVSTLGGLPIVLDGEVEIDGITLSPGKRLLAGSTASLIAGDRLAYNSGEEERAGLFSRLFESLAKTLSSRGALVWFSQLMDIIVNQCSTDMTVSQLLELVELSDGIKPEDISIHLLPGQNKDGRYIADKEKTAELLNISFRTKGEELPESELGFG